LFIYSLYVGKYYLFLLGAQDTSPVKIFFRDRETIIRGKKPPYTWKEKIYLYPAILQRKWIDYKIKDRYIPSADYDNVLPCEMHYNFLNTVYEPAEIRIRTEDKQYRNLTLQLIDENGEPAASKILSSLRAHQEKSVQFRIEKPGEYTLCLSTDEGRYSSSRILFAISPPEEYRCSLESFLTNHFQGEKFLVYCGHCRSRIHPAEIDSIERSIYRNYIPFKEYIDLERLEIDTISKYIRTLDHPPLYKKGLIHLLNIIRLASYEDEISIVTSLLKDEPAFAHFVIYRLFLFNMIPLMKDRDVQLILNSVDDRVIALSLEGTGTLLRDKIMKNISKRRAASIRSEKGSPADIKKTRTAQEHLHRTIRHFFEHHVGRLLKIPLSTIPVYKTGKLNQYGPKSYRTLSRKHTGCFIATNDKRKYFLIQNSSVVSDNCLPYDVEWYGDRIFSFTGATEGTIYLMSEIGIRYVFIHLYYWFTSLEDSLFLENISKYTIIPLSSISAAMILTVGALSGSETAHEQVLRVRMQ
jgi:hypothetical protein